MTSATTQVVNELGIHLRAAARLVRLAENWPCAVSLTANGATVDGKSLLGITALLARKGTQLTVTASGDGEEEAVAALTALVAGGFATEP
ncbi:MAG: HPr family phosphocarrier protein [Myxococcota bacterium]|nr:HPr family phosphocarrier protein [Myxococcota bacterium]